MKRFIFLIALLIISLSSQKATAQENIIKPASGDSIALGVLLIICITILLVLVIRLIKNGKKLDDAADTPEKDGKQWLTGNLKDLDAHQIEILIKRSKSLK